jgi:hypothetical protein
MRRRRRLFSAILGVISIGLGSGMFSCSPGKPAQPPPAPSTSTSTAKTTSDDGLPICQRVCAVQTKCGGDPKACTMKCMPIARILLPEVLDQMVGCVEKKAPPSCDDDAVASRKRLIGECVVDATQSKGETARTNIALFAKAFCDRTKTCGSNTGVISASECMGEARGAIMSTEGDASGGLYGSLRASKLDEMIACLGGPCDQRKEHADEEVERCLNEVLAKAAESTP